MFSQKLLKQLPPSPGVYIFRNRTGTALYVGKAVNLKKRVSSYLQKGITLGPKTKSMLSKTTRIEHTETLTELEALLLEADLIKELKPKYNNQWKDDKRYQYIKVSKGKGQKAYLPGRKAKGKFSQHEDYPTLLTSRKTNTDGIYFGPFPEAHTVKRVLKTLRKIFPFRDCSKIKFNKYAKIKRGCLLYDIELCPGPCIGKISAEEYEKNIKKIIRFLKGEKQFLILEYEKEMHKKVKEKNFEEAAEIRDQIRRLEYITQNFRQPADFFKTPNLVEDQRALELAALSTIIREESEALKELKRIEAYDISNINGQQATGSMIVFISGAAKTSHYRKFKIKTSKKPDDVAMMKELLRRRFSRVCKQDQKVTASPDQSFSKTPNLILVDGGKPQVSAARQVLKEYNLQIPVIGLAKKTEQIITTKFSTINLPRNSPALQLLQKIRDEAHRFAKSYHKKLRLKNIISS